MANTGPYYKAIIYYTVPHRAGRQYRYVDIESSVHGALMTEKGILEDGGCTNLVAYTLDAWGREQERIEL